MLGDVGCSGQSCQIHFGFGSAAELPQYKAVRCRQKLRVSRASPCCLEAWSLQEKLTRQAPYKVLETALFSGGGCSLAAAGRLGSSLSVVGLLACAAGKLCFRCPSWRLSERDSSAQERSGRSAAFLASNIAGSTLEVYRQGWSPQASLTEEF